MIRNREFLIFSLISILTAIAVSVICAVTYGFVSGLLCFLGCVLVYTVCMLFSWHRYIKMRELSEYLYKIASGGTVLDIRDNAEGELSILKNEIYKATNALSQQADMLHKDRLELTNALSDISHQLKTPLTSLNIMTELLSDDSLPPDKREEFLDSIRARLNRMEWLVLSLLKLARIDADAVTMKKERISLSDLTKKAIAPFIIPMEIKCQSYEISGDDSSLECDAEWTAEALGNIIKNAVENTPECGNINISYGINPLFNFISVQDNGNGIDKTDLPYLFKRFYRGKNAGQDSVGIGLAMSLAIMRKQDGDIEVLNDNGCVFTLKFYHSGYSGDQTVT